MSEVIDPSHYRGHRIEPIDVIEDWQLPYTLGCAVKYISRHPYKGTSSEDLMKASNYCFRESTGLWLPREAIFEFLRRETSR